MSNVDRERPWQVSHDDVPNPARRKALMFLGALGAVGFATILLKKLPPEGPDTNSDDQKQASKFIEQAENEGSLIKAQIIQPDDENEPGKLRTSPAVLSANTIVKSDIGDEIDGIVVSDITGYQDATKELPGTWFAFEIRNGRIGFINTKFVERMDKQPLFQAGTKIYNTQTGEYVVLGQAQTSQ